MTTLIVRARDSRDGGLARQICAARNAARCLVGMCSYATALGEELTVQILGGTLFVATRSIIIICSIKIRFDLAMHSFAEHVS